MMMARRALMCTPRCLALPLAGGRSALTAAQTQKEVSKNLHYFLYNTPGWNPPPVEKGRSSVPACPSELLSPERNFYLHHFYPVDHYNWDRVLHEKAHGWGPEWNVWAQTWIALVAAILCLVIAAFWGCWNSAIFPAWFYWLFGITNNFNKDDYLKSV